ncbi:MAG: type II secretion system GspH family protein [Candidatus Pacebacteria bacterium]|nr:type II secretion system GspH family protein [Candidatus Paceibacterota bacterium]
MHTHRHHTESGFTLIEVMVSVSIFAIIVSVGIGALFNMNTSYTYSKAQQRLMDHINFAMETMSRELRTGFDYVCGSDDMTSSSLTPTSCGVTGSNRIVFAADFDQTGYDIIGYRLSNQKLQKANGAGASFF